MKLIKSWLILRTQLGQLPKTYNQGVVRHSSKSSWIKIIHSTLKDIPLSFPVSESLLLECVMRGLNANSAGRAAIVNLQHVISHCPQLAGPALKLSARIYRESTRDTSGYISTIHAYHNLDISQQDGTLSGDSAWVEEMELRNAKEKNKLEAELRTYSSNMIKESIRVSLSLIL